MKEQQVPAPVVTAPTVMVEVQKYRTMAVFRVPGVSDSDLYKARQRLIALRMDCSVVDIGGGQKALSISIKTVRERGEDFMREVQSCLRDLPGTVLKLA